MTLPDYRRKFDIVTGYAWSAFVCVPVAVIVVVVCTGLVLLGVIGTSKPYVRWEERRERKRRPVFDVVTRLRALDPDQR